MRPWPQDFGYDYQSLISPSMVSLNGLEIVSASL